jgi:hypothetical protein
MSKLYQILQILITATSKKGDVAAKKQRKVGFPDPTFSSPDNWY